MLGRALKGALRAGGFKVRGLTRARCDVTDRRAVSRALDSFKPDVVVNSAAYTNVDLCEFETRAARRVNGLAPGLLAAACKRRGCVLVHVSTDSVFGDHARGRRETDRPDPINAYGRSKAEGEKAVRAAGGDWYIVRTCCTDCTEAGAVAFNRGLYSEGAARIKKKNWIFDLRLFERCLDRIVNLFSVDRKDPLRCLRIFLIDLKFIFSPSAVTE